MTVTRKYIGLDWVVPVDEVRLEFYKDFNYVINDDYDELKYPDLWKSVYRGHGIFASPTTTRLDDPIEFFTLSSYTEDFKVGETVTGNESKAVGTVTKFEKSFSFTGVYLENVKGVFKIGEVVKTSGGSKGIISDQIPSPVRAMAKGKVIHSSNGIVGILHENAGQEATSFYVYVNPSIKIGDVVEARDIIGTLIDRGQQTLLYIEIYEGFVNSVSDSSRWGNLGARPLKNDKYLVNPSTIIGDSFALIRFDPFVTEITPASGPLSGGTKVEVKGSKFIKGIRVFLGVGYKEDEDKIKQLVDYVSGLPVDLPEQTLEVLNNGENTSDINIVDEDAFDLNGPYEGPILKTKNKPIVIPDNSGRIAYHPSAVSVTINGSPVSVSSVDGLSGLITLNTTPNPLDQVRISYSINPNIGTVFIDENKILFYTPPSPIGFPQDSAGKVSGLVDIIIINPEEGLFGKIILEKGFRYDPKPRIVSITPSSGPSSGGTVVKILGNNFKESSKVSIYNSLDFSKKYIIPPIDTKFVSESELQVVMPPKVINPPLVESPITIANSLDKVSFEVINSDSEKASLEDSFRYLDPPSLDISTYPTGINPDKGVTSGTSPDIPRVDFTASIYGNNFRTLSTDTRIFGEDASEINAIDGINTTLVTKNKPIVDNTDTGTILTLSNIISDNLSVLVDNSPVSISSIDGENGIIVLSSPPLPGQEVLINYYTNEYKKPKIFFGDKKARIAGFDTEPEASIIDVYYPPNSEGTYTVKIVNPDGQFVETSFSYIRNDDPSVVLIIPSNLTSGEDLKNTYPVSDDDSNLLD